MGSPAVMTRPAGSGGSGCGKLLGCGCLFLLLLLGLGAGGVVIGSRTLLSSPKAFVGVWKVLDTEKGKATDLGSFKAEVAGDGLKVKPAGNVDDVVAFEMKKNGPRSFKGRATNPDNKDEWADLTLTMGFWGRRLAVTVEASDGKKENWSAQRDLQATLEDAVKK